jgi:quinol-cytochrome oxidoreductase complex cytochrome b subunit
VLGSLRSDQAPISISRRSYGVIGIVCLAASIPSWILLAVGRLFTGRDPFLLIPFAGVPVGVMLLLFSADRFQRTRLSDNGFRVALIAVSVAACGLASWFGARAGAEALLTATRFCVMAASYLAFFSFAVLIAAAAKGNKPA